LQISSSIVKGLAILMMCELSAWGFCDVSMHPDPIFTIMINHFPHCVVTTVTFSSLPTMLTEIIIILRAYFGIKAVREYDDFERTEIICFLCRVFF